MHLNKTISDVWPGEISFHLIEFKKLEDSVNFKTSFREDNYLWIIFAK